MIVNRSVEHAVLSVLMLALQAGHRPLKSHVMSGLLGVSDSYLKKTLRKLAVAGLVESSASRDGGYTLARPADQLSIGDVYRAMEPDGFTFRASPLAEAVFPDEGSHVREQVGKVSAAFTAGHGAFLDSLDSCRLSDLLNDGAWQEGIVDWETRLRELEPADGRGGEG